VFEKACKLPNGSERMWREHADLRSAALDLANDW